MADDCVRGEGEAPWRAGFRDAEEQALEASLAATPSQRLRWLEQAIEFAWKVGALPERED